MERLHNWTIGVAGICIAATLTSLLAAGWKAWVAVGLSILTLIVFGVLLLQVWLRRPRLYIGEPEIEDTQVHLGNEESFPIRLAYLKVWNHPRFGAEPIDLTWVDYRFVDEETGTARDGDILARWSGKARLENYAETTEPRTQQMRGDSTRYRVDLLFIRPDDEKMYIIDEESRFVGWFERPLGLGPLVVVARAQGSIAGAPVDETFRFRVVNHSGEFKIRPIRT